MIVILLAFSIWRIRKFSKILVQSQIFANECLMVSHLAAFTYLALLNIYSQTINIIYQGSSDYTLEEMSDRRKRILLSSVVVQYLSVGGCLAVVITMMIMFKQQVAAARCPLGSIVGFRLLVSSLHTFVFVCGVIRKY